MKNNKDILIIDDEQVILDAVSKIAAAEGWKVDTALNALEALEKFNHTLYSLILCDIMMPDMDGFQLLDKINEKKLIIPVIMITGYSTVENAVNSLYKGAADFISKPFTFEEITTAIYRGIEYGKILFKLDQIKKNGGKQGIVYVPCPASYKRLGNITWMDIEYQGTAVIGLTDFYLKTIKNIVKIELLENDNVIVQGSSCLKLETEDGLVHNCLAALGGRIIERNEKLINEPTLLEKDPYFEGWLYKIIPSDVEYEMKYLISCSSDRIE